MSVFTFPLDDTQDRKKVIDLVNSLAEMVGAAVSVKESLTFVTNNTRLCLILKQIACDDPEHPLVGDADQSAPRRHRARTKKGEGVTDAT